MTAERDKGGRFAEGGPSPNPAGRPKGRSRRIETLEQLDELTVKVANRKVRRQMPDGSISTIPLVEQALLQAGSTNPHARLGAQSILQIVRASYANLDRLERIGKRSARPAEFDD